MKKLLFLILFTAYQVAAMAQQNNANNRSKIYFNSFDNISIGWICPLDKPNGFDTNFLTTAEIQMTAMNYGFAQGKWNFDFNTDLYFSAYHLKGDNYIASNKVGDAFLRKFSDGTKDRKAWLFAYGIELSLMTYRKLNDFDRVGFGLIYRPLFGHSLATYKDTDNQKTTDLYSIKAFNGGNWGIKMEYQMKDVSYYVKYMPMHTMHEKKGIAFSTLSFGFGIK
ncbi:MAG: hypothetical protein J6Y99_08465 [Bacteroidales bacterium]|nr:hypothetical protein [Bacteroidales bacterium]